MVNLYVGIDPNTPYNISATWLVGTANYQLNVSWQNPAYESDWCRNYPDNITVSFNLSNKAIGNRLHNENANPKQTFLIVRDLSVSYMYH